MWDTIVATLEGILGIGDSASKAAGVFSTAWATVTDFRMWRSLGWLLLGIVLIIIGFVIWNRHAIGAAAGTIAAAA